MEMKMDDRLKERIEEIAVMMSPDYPGGLAGKDPWEQLAAISAAYQGTDAANAGCHRVIGYLRTRLGWSAEDVANLPHWLSVEEIATTPTRGAYSPGLTYHSTRVALHLDDTGIFFLVLHNTDDPPCRLKYLTESEAITWLQTDARYSAADAEALIRASQNQRVTKRHKN